MLKGWELYKGMNTRRRVISSHLEAAKHMVMVWTHMFLPRSGVIRTWNFGGGSLQTYDPELWEKSATSLVLVSLGVSLALVI